MIAGRFAAEKASTAAVPRTPNLLTLAPVANVGFTGDRASFCTQFTLAGPNRDQVPANDTFCPDTGETDMDGCDRTHV